MQRNIRQCFCSWRMIERDAAEIKDGLSETLLHPFPFLPGYSVATQSGFSCHLEKLMECILQPLFPDIVVYIAAWTSAGV